MTDANNNNNEITLNDLALMVKEGFDEMGKRISSSEGSLRSEITGLQSEMTGLRGEMQKGFKRVDDALEQVNLRLDNTAHRFELVELEGRVDVVEKKVGIERRR